MVVGDIRLNRLWLRPDEHAHFYTGALTIAGFSSLMSGIPEFPGLHRFLAFWQNKLDGPLYSMRVAHCRLIKAIDGQFQLH